MNQRGEREAERDTYTLICMFREKCCEGLAFLLFLFFFPPILPNYYFFRLIGSLSDRRRTGSLIPLRIIQSIELGKESEPSL